MRTQLPEGLENTKVFLANVARLLDAAIGGRHGARDHLLLDMIFRHGLRVSEAITLRRDDLNLGGSRLWVGRLRNGQAFEHPIAGDELRAIERYLATRSDMLPWLFVSERGQRLTRQSVNYIVTAAARRAGLPPLFFRPQTLRHACAILLLSENHDLGLVRDYLGHRVISTTLAYYSRIDHQAAAQRFEALLRDHQSLKRTVLSAFG